MTDYFVETYHTFPIQADYDMRELPSEEPKPEPPEFDMWENHPLPLELKETQSLDENLEVGF